MRIGITYDLKSEYLRKGYSDDDVAEFDDESTVEAIVDALGGLGHEVDPVGGIEALVGRLAVGDRWDLVFNICEGLNGRARESQVPALLEAYSIPFTFSDPAVLALTLDKALTKRVLIAHGIPTARFHVVERPDEADEVSLPLPLFAKPVAEGSSKGIDRNSRIGTREELRARCQHLLAAYRQPVLVEEYLPGEEFTVGILGTGDAARVLGVSRIRVKDPAFSDHYCRELKTIKEFETVLEIELCTSPGALQAAQAALSAWRVLGCRDAGRVDVRLDARGQACVIEVNPLAGLVPGFSDLVVVAEKSGLSYRGLIGGIVASASERVAPKSPTAVRGGGRGQRVCAVLHSPAGADDSVDAQDVHDQVRAVEEALRRQGYAAVPVELSSDLVRAESMLRRLDPAFAFCLVESFAGRDTLSHVGPALLEDLRIPFSGNGSQAFLVTSDKVLAKGILRRHGIRTPDWATESAADLGHDPAEIEFIVKPRHLDASRFIDQDSIVSVPDLEALRAVLAKRRRAHGTEFFAEEFIDGREFNLSLLGRQGIPEVFDPSEIVFDGFEEQGIRRIVDYGSKWLPETFGYQHVERRFASDGGDGLFEELRAAAARCWEVFELSGYARVDFRVARDGAIHVVEINANPCISPDSGFMVTLEHHGLDHDTLVSRLMEEGNARAR